MAGPERGGRFGGGRRRRRRHETASAWQEAGAAVSVDDAVIASALAQEALTPFGYKRPAQELLAHFGGDPARATAALTLAGVVAEPPLHSAEPTTWIQLRRAEAADPDQEVREVTGPPDQRIHGVPSPRRASWAQRTAARHLPSGPVTRERRVTAGALGLGALLVVLLLAVAARGLLGGGGNDGERLSDALPGAAATQTQARTAPRTTRAPRPVAPPPSRARARPRTVRLVIAPTEPSYVCVADGRTRATLWEGMLTGRWSARRPSLILRVGVATARIGVDGRRLQIRSAPSAYLLTPRGVSGLPADRPVCGAG